MIKWLGPILLLFVLAFGVASFLVRSLVGVFSVLLIVAVFVALIVTFTAEVKDMRRREKGSQ